jgi:hypothetical protein
MIFFDFDGTKAKKKRRRRRRRRIGKLVLSTTKDGLRAKAAWL